MLTYLSGMNWGVWIVTCQALRVAWDCQITNWEVGGARALLHGGDGTSFSEGMQQEAHGMCTSRRGVADRVADRAADPCELACAIWKNWHSVSFSVIPKNSTVYIALYWYIYIYTHTYIYIYIHTYGVQLFRL